MTPVSVSIVGAVAALVLLAIVLEMVRSRRLHERYAVLWLGTGLIVLILSAWRGSLDWIAGLLGVAYPPALLFAIGGVFVGAVLLHVSIVISGLVDKNRKLAQELALLREQVERQADQADGGTMNRRTTRQ